MVLNNLIHRNIMFTSDEIKDRLTKKGKIYVELNNGLHMYLVAYDSITNKFIGTYLPCVKDAQKYEIDFEKIDEIYEY